ncbi:MAG: ABC transporter ATP-binding protein [Tissierellia bacterium]|nr:ABC transporter ATP-binding protein [Tissierellia bacterium]
MIKCEDVSLIYQGNTNVTKALEHIDLEINESDFIAILGPSGCGKSSLLKLIAGFIKPTSGQVLKNNKIIQGPGVDRGVVFQSTNLYPWLNVEENIQYGLKIQKVDFDEMKKKTTKYLEKTQLYDFRKLYPFELSGGMQQRVALSRTLITNPDIVLMDEPFGALDAITRASMQVFVRNMWAEESQTFLIVTHDIDEALKLGNRVIIMSPQPGVILKEYHVEFYKTLLKNPYEMIENQKNYLALKQEMLKYING